MPLPPFAAITALRDGMLVRIKSHRFLVPWNRIEEDLLAPIAVELDRARQHGLLPEGSGKIDAAIAADRRFLAQHAQSAAVVAAPANAAARSPTPPAAPWSGGSAPRAEPADPRRKEAIAWVIACGYPPDAAPGIVDQEGVDRILSDERRKKAPTAAAG